MESIGKINVKGTEYEINGDRWAKVDSDMRLTTGNVRDGVDYCVRHGICTVRVRKLTLSGPGATLLGKLPFKAQKGTDFMAPLIMFQDTAYPWSGTVGALWVNEDGNVWASTATSGSANGWSGTLTFPIAEG